MVICADNENYSNVGMRRVSKWNDGTVERPRAEDSQAACHGPAMKIARE